MIRAVLPLLALSFPFSSLAQVYEFTGDGDTNGWGDNENWKQGAQDPANSFPENGAEAIVDGVSGLLSAELSKNITLSSFQLAPNQQFSLNLDGNTLDVGQLREFGVTSIIRDGTLIVDNLDIGDLRVVNTTFNIAGGTITGSGLQLWSGTTATLAGTLSIGATGLASGDSDAKFVNAGGSIFKENTDDLATVSAPFEQSGGNLNVSLGTLSFTNSATFTGGDIEVSGSDNAIRFQGATSVLNTMLSLKSGATMAFTGPLTGQGIDVAEGSEGMVSISVDNDGIFGVSDFNGKANSPIALNTGTQDTNTPASNSGVFIWGGGVLDDFTNNSEMRIESTGASFSGRGLTGLLSNNETMEVDASITLKAISVIQNEVGGTLEAASGTIKPFTGDLEQTGFANLGTIDTPFSKGGLNIQTRIINRGEIIINKGSINFSGPLTELGGQVTLSPHSFEDGFETALNLGGDSDISHTIKDLLFMGNAPAGDKGGARAIFGRGQYTVAGEMSSSAGAASDQFGVLIEHGTWKSDTGGSFAFDENLPLEVGGENIYPLFQLDKPLSNSGHMEITRATIVGEETFSNHGTITARRLELGNDDASGKLTNERDLILSSAATSLIDIEDGSFFLNKGENAVLSLVASAAIESPLDSTQVGFENSGTIKTVAPNNGKSINVLFRQKGSNAALIEAAAGAGNLTIRRKAEIEEGTIKSATTIFFTDDVEWGKSATPQIELVDGGEINYFGNGKTFTLLDHLFGSGKGTFELDFGTIAPEAGATKDLDFSEETEFVVAGGQLGVSGATLRNFGNIAQKGGELHGAFINAGIYTLTAGTFADADFTNLNTFNWNGNSLSGDIDNTNNFTSEGPRPAMNITGNTRLITGSTLTNNGMVSHSGRMDVEANTTINLVSGTYQFINSGSLLKLEAGLNSTLFQIQNGATLLATYEDTLNSGSSSINTSNFELNGGTIETRKNDSGLTIISNEISLNGGFIRVGEGGRISVTGSVSGSGIGSLIVGKNGRFSLNNSDQENETVPAKNIINEGTILGDVVQSEAYDTYDPDDEDLFVPSTSTIEGDLTQTPGDDLKTVVRANNEGASTINVEGDANIAGPVVLILDEDYEGTEVPILTADQITGAWNPQVQIVSPTPGLSGTISYPTPQSAIVTIERDTEAGVTQESYQTFAYTHFNANDLSDETIWGPLADPDGDGVSNLQSFAQGDDPTDGVPPPPIIADFSVSNECDACDNCSESCDPDRYIGRCRLNLRDDISGLNINLIDLGDLTNPNDDRSISYIRVNEPAIGEGYYIEIVDEIEPQASDSDYFEIEIELNEGEAIL
ncbi:hypothetical protein MLD52_22030 [Puniceicoccaceae bacterium K14]|nr:hypothetical protein [Puniceicoccaceae bacterium K14]